MHAPKHLRIARKRRVTATPRRTIPSTGRKERSSQGAIPHLPTPLQEPGSFDTPHVPSGLATSEPGTVLFAPVSHMYLQMMWVVVGACALVAEGGMVVQVVGRRWGARWSAGE